MGSQTFPRLRVGTGNHFKNAVDFVLAPFNQSEKAEIDFILSKAVESVIYWINNGITNTMNKYNKDLPELRQEKKTRGE